MDNTRFDDVEFHLNFELPVKLLTSQFDDQFKDVVRTTLVSNS